MADIQWLVGGEAGYGIMTSGVMMAKIFTRLGQSVFDYVEYPSLIRGGHNAYYVRASDETIYSQKRAVDILVALNRETIDKHEKELAPHAVILYDPESVTIQDGEFDDKKILMPVPFFQLSKSVGGDRLMTNTVSIGASLAAIHDDYSVLEKMLQDTFGKKGGQVIKINIDTSKAGFDYVREHFSGKSSYQVHVKKQECLLIGGAEAIALGAIRAGVKFAAIYPMTPVNTIMTTLTQHSLTYNIITKEPEDEIAGINMAIGAGFAGVRSMAATSGGGFALMTEGVGLAAQAEVPLVLIEGMRPGPATGMPTWSDQGDIRFLLHSGQGDFPHVVLSPGDAMELFTMTMQAFNLAEKYQMPIIIVGDKNLLEGHYSVNSLEFKTKSSEFKLERGKLVNDTDAKSFVDYKRYELTLDGVSPRTIPGQEGGIALTGSDEHDEHGLYDEEIENRKKMVEKRRKKFVHLTDEIHPFDLHGSHEALLTIVAFGSTKLPVMDAMQLLKKENVTINFLQIHSLSPFPTEEVSTILHNAEKTLVIEGNESGLFEGLIREYTGLSMDHHFRKYDGRPFYPEEIVEKIKSLV